MPRWSILYVQVDKQLFKEQKMSLAFQRISFFVLKRAYGDTFCINEPTEVGLCYNMIIVITKWLIVISTMVLCCQSY